MLRKKKIAPLNGSTIQCKEYDDDDDVDDNYDDISHKTLVLEKAQNSSYLCPPPHQF